MGVIDFPLSCRWCGGSLKGQALEGKCPHCGHAVGDTLERRLIEPESFTVSGDAYCAKCNYNLRTMAISGVCPECAHPVADSLRPDELRFQELTWLRNLRAGSVYFLIWLGGILVSLIALIASGYIGVVLNVLLLPALDFIWYIGVLHLAVLDSDKNKRCLAEWEGWMVSILAMFAGISPLGILLIGIYAVLAGLLCYVFVSLFLLVYLKRLGRRIRHDGLPELINIQMMVSAVAWFSWVIFLPVQSGYFDIGLAWLVIPTIPSYIMAFVIFYRFKILFDDAIAQRANPITNPETSVLDSEKRQPS